MISRNETQIEITMLNDYLQIHTASVVFVGEFNPVIIQPFWLANKKLIREQEAQDAKVEIIHNEIVKFEIDWARIEITKNRFEIRTSQEPYFEPMKDLVISIFEILKETPISALGINHLKYYAIPNYDLYYNFGDKLVPLNNWTKIFNDPRMMFLEIVDQKRKDGLKGMFRVRVQPSDIKLSTSFGVLLTFNDQFDLNTNEDGRHGELVQILGKQWKPSQIQSTEVAEVIWSKIY